jgi:hypothetical protein
MTLPPNVVVRSVLITDLSQQMKKQRDFLKWMGRRYLSINEEQAAAFNTGARMFEELRQELITGLFDAGDEDLEVPAKEELFTGADQILPALEAARDAAGRRDLDPPAILTRGLS